MNFYQTIQAAIADIEANGFDSQQRIDRWMARIEAAARAAMVPEATVQNLLSQTLANIYKRAVERGGVLTLHPGVSRFTLQQIAPKLRGELDRRIMASANLIRLNRQQTIAKTLQRFSGWATSIPPGGSKAVDKPEVKDDLKKALRSLPYEERRVAIDQGHKLVATVHDIVALEAGAIAAEWHSNYRQPGYDARPDHKERDGLTYLIRGNWASDKGLVKPGAAGWSDAITQPAEEPFCRCQYRYIYSLRGLPADMLTAKGREALQAARDRRAAARTAVAPSRVNSSLNASLARSNIFKAFSTAADSSFACTLYKRADSPDKR